MKIGKKDKRKLDLLGDGDWPDVDRGGASITENLQALGLAETYPHPDYPERNMVRITEKGRAYLDGENVLSDRRQTIMENALKALRLVVSIHEATRANEVGANEDERNPAGLPPKMDHEGNLLGGFHGADLDPMALEQVEKAAEALAADLGLIF